MLHKNHIFHIFATRDEAETGSAGEQPARNSLAKLNRCSFVNNLKILGTVFYCLFGLLSLKKLKINFPLCPFTAGAVHYP